MLTGCSPVLGWSKRFPVQLIVRRYVCIHIDLKSRVQWVSPATVARRSPRVGNLQHRTHRGFRRLNSSLRVRVLSFAAVAAGAIERRSCLYASESPHRVCFCHDFVFALFFCVGIWKQSRPCSGERAHASLMFDRYAVRLRVRFFDVRFGLLGRPISF
jgi:hypothetical protein